MGTSMRIDRVGMSIMIPKWFVYKKFQNKVAQFICHSKDYNYKIDAILFVTVYN